MRACNPIALFAPLPDLNQYEIRNGVKQVSLYNWLPFTIENMFCNRIGSASTEDQHLTACHAVGVIGKH
jgi:hypothetical protein